MADRTNTKTQNGVAILCFGIITLEFRLKKVRKRYKLPKADKKERHIYSHDY
jgi:hypothetical protein